MITRHDYLYNKKYKYTKEEEKELILFCVDEIQRNRWGYKTYCKKFDINENTGKFDDYFFLLNTKCIQKYEKEHGEEIEI